MVLTSYEPGTLCWAKLKGYPWWPSRIEREQDLTAEVVDSKPRSGRVYPVLFFGSLDYAWITPENLEPYEENLAKYGSKAKNRKDPSFADALKQAVDPSIVEGIMKRSASTATADTSDDAEEEEEEEDNAANADSDVEMQSADSDAHTPAKARAATRRAPRDNGRTRKTTAGTKRASFSASSSGDDVDGAATPKRSRTTASKEHSVSNSGSPNGSARRDSDDSRSAAKDSPRSGSPSRHASPENKASKDDKANDRSGSKPSSSHQNTKGRSKAYQFLMQLRHRLQKTVIKGPILEDLTPVHEVFKKLEDFDMTLELIQETKMGKVMRIIASSERLGDAPEEAFDIKGRAQRLKEKWRLLVMKQRESMVDANGHESPAANRSLELDHSGADGSKSLPQTSTSPRPETGGAAASQRSPPTESAATANAKPEAAASSSKLVTDSELQRNQATTNDDLGSNGAAAKDVNASSSSEKQPQPLAAGPGILPLS
ncbi:hypothetical protein GGI07_001062 [Coemansia sp. Benny D115]|nr:hypothetical protein GGI07_001062 [Coemansia sp. Benny D115]